MQNLQIALSQETIAGVVIGAILFCALTTSRLFRTVVLAATGVLILAVYYRHGIGGLLKIWSIIVADSMRHDLFAWGFAAGVLIAVVTFWSNRPRRRRR